ncbi:MAG: hypothetical protein HY021_09735 [Burkholderiales bacterium]|nr:hypothetical protein [Burkholderiales bacterium]
MKKRMTLLAALLCCSASVLAHSGHGMPGEVHWHASDALVLLAVAAAIGLGLWLSRRDR